MEGGLGGSLPVAASEIAHKWDALYSALYYLNLVLFIGVVGAMILFAIKYRARPGHKSTYIHGNTLLEVIWTVIPTIIVMGIFVWGWVLYRDMVKVPENAYEIRAIGKRWDWTFQYPDGRSLTNEVYVPVNQPIKFLVSSQPNDVLHSLYIPNFRVKKDAVPGRFSYVTVTPDIVGQHIIFCAEYCGTSHSAMLAKLVVLTKEDFDKWWKGEEIELPPPVGPVLPADAAMAALDGSAEASASQAKAGADPVVLGKKLMQTKACTACHSFDGKTLVGPSYKGIWGQTREFEDGTTAVVDENYIKESINNPQAKIVKGFKAAGIMPPYTGQFSDEDIAAIVAYIKSLK